MKSLKSLLFLSICIVYSSLFSGVHCFKGPLAFDISSLIDNGQLERLMHDRETKEVTQLSQSRIKKVEKTYENTNTTNEYNQEYKSTFTKHFLKIRPGAFLNPIEIGVVKHNKTNMLEVKLDYCNNNNCLSKYGECVGEKTCQCNYGYANNEMLRLRNQESGNAGHYCSYNRKKQVIAMLLEIPGIGMGHYYTQNFIMFYVKFAYFLGFFLILFYFKDSSKDKIDIVWGIYFSIYMSWTIIDIVLYGVNYYQDGNYVPLLPLFDPEPLIDLSKRSLINQLNNTMH